jgi:serine/threonine protein kinase
VMLRGDMPTIVDFGIAKSLGNTTAAVTERRVGTVAYMAPEQLVDGLITPAVDIWAIGVMLYEAATGRAPFANFSDGRLPQLFESPPRASTLVAISPVLDDLIARCLERDPGKRPASMAEVARVLRGEADERVTEDIGGPPLTRRDPAPTRNDPTRRLVKWPILIGAAAGIAIGAALFVANRADKQLAPAAVPAIVPDAATVQPALPSEAQAEPPIEALPPRPEPPGDELVDRKRTKPEPKKRTSTSDKRTEKRKTSQGETLD